MRNLYLVLFILLVGIGSCEAQILNKTGSRNAERGLSVKSVGNRKEAKVKKTGSARKAIKRQEAKDRKLDRAYDKSIKMSQKRTVDIQTPEVKTRMKKDKKDLAVRDRVKKKKVKARTKMAEKKYK